MEKKIKVILIIASILILLGIAVYALNSNALTTNPTAPAGKNTTTITDMMGRTLVVPANISRVLSTGPPTTIEVYVLAPDKLIGVNFDPNPTNGSTYLPAKYQDLPNVGGWFGKQTGNYENFISANPEIILDGDLGTGNYVSTLEDHQQKFGAIPVVGITEADNVTGYDTSIKFLGILLGADEQAASLSEFYNRVMSMVQSRVSSIPDSEKVRVYYAEGPKGLQTDPTGSSHSELIELAGGINVADCALTPGMGMTPVSMEQVTTWDPDIIIVGDPGFYKTIYNDTLWMPIKALKNHRVYLVPQSPFTWFDRPPGVNRIIGIPWTAKVLYPDKFSDMDLPALTKEFYSKFYHYNLTDNEVNTLLKP
ncbi:iron ABC transporter substrate-binding protein [Methanoregula sp.]|uniref:iron ABC transporter substrate-binding protein n=1 Tax=Methanoregula sp. TaxID=2052170 RepID=UPI003C73953C